MPVDDPLQGTENVVSAGAEDQDIAKRPKMGH
jgi:hypothetical protein